MSIEELKQKILEVIAESTETDLELTEDTEFGVRIPASALRNVRTTGDLCSLVIRKMT